MALHPIGYSKFYLDLKSSLLCNYVFTNIYISVQNCLRRSRQINNRSAVHCEIRIFIIFLDLHLQDYFMQKLGKVSA
jgi:hypothetical protein